MLRWRELEFCGLRTGQGRSPFYTVEGKFIISIIFHVICGKISWIHPLGDVYVHRCGSGQQSFAVICESSANRLRTVSESSSNRQRMVCKSSSYFVDKQLTNYLSSFVDCALIIPALQPCAIIGSRYGPSSKDIQEGAGSIQSRQLHSTCYSCPTR